MKIPALRWSSALFTVGAMLIAAAINRLALGVPLVESLLTAAAAFGVGELALYIWRRVRDARDRRSFNCASCGQHHPTPSVLVTLGGTFEAEDATHAGVCVAWCKACAAEDVLHAATLRHVHNNDMPRLMVVLAALAHRGPGRVNWMSQDTLDRMRKINNMPVHPVTSERTVH